MNTKTTLPKSIAQQKTETFTQRRNNIGFTTHMLILLSLTILIFISLLGASYIKQIGLGETAEAIAFILLFGSGGGIFIGVINRIANANKKEKHNIKKSLSSFSEKPNTYISNLKTMKGGQHTIENRTIPHSSKSLREKCSWAGFYHAL